MRTVSSYTCGIPLGCLLAALLVPQPVLAQTAAGQSQKGRWTFEVYVGGAAPTVSTGGTPLTDFPVGATFTTDAGRPSRLQSSWYFGDGARMLNDALTEFAQINGTAFARIVPLDTVLTTNALTRSPGAVFGARLGRSLLPRLAVEIGVERSRTPLAFTGGFKDTAQRSSDSFQSAFQDLLESAPVNGVEVASSLDVSEAASHETRVTGAFTYRLVQSGKVAAYATAGGGLAMTGGDGPEAILIGTYAFRYLGTIPMRELDRAFIRVDQPSNAAMVL